MKRVLAAALALGAVTVGICALLEGGARVYFRLSSGRWPQTLASVIWTGRQNSNRIFRADPYLNTAPREGTSTVATGRHMSFNSRGYRSPERSPAKPPGTLRVVTAGGSTTFDIGVPDDSISWPWQLETDLRQRGVAAEVWNAGFPGWTSQENVIALAIRDLDLQPDLLVLYQGINDLQPAATVPFDAEYESDHVRLSKEALGIAEAPLPWYRYSVFLENTLPQARKWVGLAEPSAPPVAARLGRVPDEALATFERNVRSFIALGRSHGARVMLVTQPLRLRSGQAFDAALLEQWIPGLDGRMAPRELERFNDVLRHVAVDEKVELGDAAREVAWEDVDFVDPMHFGSSGSTKLAAYLAAKVAAGPAQVGGS
jgi:lysophospholipase L1-like esterase